MRARNLFIIIITALFFFSCQKKDRLNNEREILVGKWNWLHTDRYHYCDEGYQHELLDSVSENVTYQIEFLKKGILRFYRDNILTSEHELKVKWSDIPEYGIVESNKEIRIRVYLDGDIENTLYIFGTPKKMRFNYFPFKVDKDCISSYGNYFRKEY